MSSFFCSCLMLTLWPWVCCISLYYAKRMGRTSSRKKSRLVAFARCVWERALFWIYWSWLWAWTPSRDSVHFRKPPQKVITRFMPSNGSMCPAKVCMAGGPFWLCLTSIRQGVAATHRCTWRLPSRRTERGIVLWWGADANGSFWRPSTWISSVLCLERLVPGPPCRTLRWHRPAKVWPMGFMLGHEGGQGEIVAFCTQGRKFCFLRLVRRLRGYFKGFNWAWQVQFG